jgi:predicted AlkP superfamily phosphohydrolase/phosphomutase
MSFPKTLIIGIDGATFDLIQPWAQAGLLPTLSRLMREGASATLDAFPSMNSAAAWTNIVTGYNPGQHAIFDFVNGNREERGNYPVTARDRKRPAFWQTLAASGKRVGVMNVPISYPAENINGFMLSGMDTPDPQRAGFSEPHGLLQELRDAGIDYILDAPSLKEPSRREPNVVPMSIRHMVQARTRGFLYLLEKYPCDVAMVVYIASDRMMHYYFRDTPPTPDAPEWVALRDLYRLLDAQLAELLSHTDSETSVFVLSDHGFGFMVPLRDLLNQALIQLEYQTPQPLRKNVRGMALELGRRIVPQNWQRGLAERFPKTHSGALRANRLGRLDLPRTRAYQGGGGSHSIRINSTAQSPQGIVSDADYDALCTELSNDLLALTDAETGKPLFCKVTRRAFVYRGPYASEANDLFVHWNMDAIRQEVRYARNGRSFIMTVPLHSPDWSGVHCPQGIFIAYGKGIRPGQSHPTVTHFDLVPTVLYLNDQPIPDDLDGHALLDWFDPKFIADHPLQRNAATPFVPTAQPSLPDAEQALIEDRLRQLGYLE